MGGKLLLDHFLSSNQPKFCRIPPVAVLGEGERGALLAWQQQTVAKPEKGRAGFYIPAPSIPSMGGIFFEMFVSQIFSIFKL